jgi:hypothetical protein
MIIKNVLDGQSTVIIALVLVAALTFLGAVAFDPLPPRLRVAGGYFCAILLVLIGIGGLYLGCSFEVPLVFLGVYIFDPTSMAWIAVGAISFIVGAIILRQTYVQR